MRIDDNHLYHGAALIQIAEHPQFTAINSLKLNGDVIPVAYRINDEIAVYLKYASKPTKSFKEYAFTFKKDQLDLLNNIAAVNPKTFLALVCVKAREICCISTDDLESLVAARLARAKNEDQYVILVTASKGKSFRVYVNAPGKRGRILGQPLVVSRKAFPDVIFA